MAVRKGEARPDGTANCSGKQLPRETRLVLVTRPQCASSSQRDRFNAHGTDYSSLRAGVGSPMPKSNQSELKGQIGQEVRKREMSKLKSKPGMLSLLLLHQDRVCALCGKDIAPQSQMKLIPQVRRASIDHVVPRSLGGVDKMGNMLASHSKCNGIKGDRMPNGCEMVWLQAVNARLGINVLDW